MKIKILKEAEETMPIGQMRGDPQEIVAFFYYGRGDDQSKVRMKRVRLYEEMSTGQAKEVLDKHKKK